MKLSLLVTLLSCLFTCYTHAQGQASVYFCRTGATDGVYEIRTSSASVGMSIPDTYVTFKGEPGTYTFTAQIAGVKNSFTMDLQDGQTYFVETLVRFREGKRVPVFQEFSLQQARTSLNNMEKGLGEKLLQEVYNSAPQDDPAVVYFYRSTDSKTDMPFEIESDSVNIGVVVPKAYVAYTAKPGIGVFNAQIAGRNHSITIDLKAGLTYFIRCYTVKKDDSLYPEFQQVSKEKAREDLNRIEAGLGTKLVKETLIETNIDQPIQVEYFRYDKKKINDEFSFNFYGDDDTLRIESVVKLKPKTFSQNMVFSRTPYQWIFDKKKSSILYRQPHDTTVTILNNNITIGENIYHVKKGKNNKQWNYFKGNEVVLACSYQKKDGEKYNVLDFYNVPPSDKKILTVLSLYYGHSVITKKSTAPLVMGILVTGAVLRTMVANQF